jgi:uncharacterized protein
MPEHAPPPASFASLTLEQIAQIAGARHTAPTEQWDPPFCGDSGIRIAADGTWFHQGAPIRRPAMVRLFSSLLRREADGTYVLVTPVEKVSVTVEALPFTAVEVASEGAGPERRLAFRLNTDEPVIAGPDHPLLIRDDIPLLLVRPGIEALLSRPIYYELAELALAEGNDPSGLWSNSAFFRMDPA